MKKIKNPWLHLTDEGYNCFGCAPSNPWGLKLEAYEDGEEVVALWNAHDNFQGWIKTLHGGIQAALLDEIAGWLVFRKLQSAAQTVRLNMKYHKPVPTGEDIMLRVSARLVEMKRNMAIITAELRYNDEICSSADIVYYCFNKEQSQNLFHFEDCVLEEEE